MTITTAWFRETVRTIWTNRAALSEALQSTEVLRCTIRHTVLHKIEAFFNFYATQPPSLFFVIFRPTPLPLVIFGRPPSPLPNNVICEWSLALHMSRQLARALSRDI